MSASATFTDESRESMFREFVRGFSRSEAGDASFDNRESGRAETKLSFRVNEADIEVPAVGHPELSA